MIAFIVVCAVLGYLALGLVAVRVGIHFDKDLFEDQMNRGKLSKATATIVSILWPIFIAILIVIGIGVGIGMTWGAVLQKFLGGSYD